MGLFNKKTAKKTAKMGVVRPDSTPIVYDFETEKEACLEALVSLVGEQNAAEGLHFITTQCKNDPSFVKMIFDPEKRQMLTNLTSNLNPAALLGSFAEKFAGVL